MCAITGIISSFSEYNNNDLLKSMLSAMLHRGPDGSETELFGNNGGFGHNRLSIIDINNRSKQPMWDKSHRYCITLNGEIYNYQELKTELQKDNHVFNTESDTEVLVEAWVKWRTHAIEKCVGMFAFAVWDDVLKQLFLVRDRMGEKPLYYAPIQNDFSKGIVFASTLKGLLKHPYIEKTLSLSALDHYLSFGYTSTDDCIYNHIYKLAPASYLLYDANSSQSYIHEYWVLSDFFRTKKSIRFEDAQEQLNFLLNRAVKLQSISDVPLGAFLSGGIDSSSIVANLHPSINTFSIGFEEKTYNELETSEIIAKHLSVKHHKKIVTSNYCNHLEKIISAFDEPFSDNSIIPTYFLSAFAKQSTTVCLSGDGGDELFGGYPTYQADRYHHAIRHFPFFLKKCLSVAANYLPTSHNKISLDYKIKQFLQGCLLNKKEAHINWRNIFNTKNKMELYKRDFQFENQLSELKWFLDVSDCHYLDQAMYVDMKTWLVNDILVKVDSASMAHALEVRAPFLDHRIVEFAAGLPINYKIKKRVLRHSQNKKLPTSILKQSKKGFNSPVSQWLLTTLHEIARDITTQTHLTDYFNRDYIEKIWIEHEQGLCDNGYRLFNLLCLGLWMQG